MQVSDFSGCTLSGGDVMIDPDIEACHELRYVLKMGRVEENHEEGKSHRYLRIYLNAGVGGSKRAPELT